VVLVLVLLSLLVGAASGMFHPDLTDFSGLPPRGCRWCSRRPTRPSTTLSRACSAGQDGS
jgi:hypothetical protein